MPDPISQPVYPVGGHQLSMFDLLLRFNQPEYIRHGISRISDMHLKVGEPVRYRFDSELIPLPDGAPLTQEMVERLLFPLLRDDEIARLKKRIIELAAEEKHKWFYVKKMVNYAKKSDDLKQWIDVEGKALFESNMGTI